MPIYTIRRVAKYITSIRYESKDPKEVWRVVERLDGHDFEFIEYQDQILDEGGARVEIEGK